MSTFLELQTEFLARGFAYLGTTRVKAFLNQGRRDLCEIEDWPFLETTITGTAPVTISDLRDVIYVSGRNGELDSRDVTFLLPFDPTLTTTGSGSYWYLDGLTTLKVWPADTSTSLTVRYLKVPTDLSADGDTPSEIPARYHPLIVDFAVIRGLKDKSNYDEAAALRASLEDDLDRMRNALLGESDLWQRSEMSNA